MKIGKLKLETVAPDAARLLSSTGLSVAEMRRMLSGPIPPHLLARALSACIAEEIATAELARCIVEEGVQKMRAAIAKLYAEVDGE
jgi:hypothetical protein